MLVSSSYWRPCWQDVMNEPAADSSSLELLEALVSGQQEESSSSRRGRRSGVRRHKANARERQRMHGLNDALDNLRRRVPIVSDSQKLSKIETLRLARNYIQLLDGMLKTTDHHQPSMDETANILSRGVSQATSNVIGSLLGVSKPPAAVPGLLLPPTHGMEDNNETSSNCSSSNVPPATTSAFRLNDLLADVSGASGHQVATTSNTYWSPDELLFDIFDDLPINDP